MSPVLRTLYPVLVLCVSLRISAASLANDLAMVETDPELEKLLLEELINDVDVRSEDEDDEPGPEVKRFNPNSFGFSRGRRLEELAKRLNPASFSFNRGKRASLPAPGDNSGRYAMRVDAKRAPPSGFTGMRGRRADVSGIAAPEVGDPSAAKRRPPEGYVVARGKRFPLTGWTSPPSGGLRETRDRKRTPASADVPDWPVAAPWWTKRAPPSGFQILRGKKAARATKKSPPEGFMGLRGKRSIVEEVLGTLRMRTDSNSHLARERHLRDLADVMTSIRNVPEATSDTEDDHEEAEKANFRRKFSKPMN